MLGGRVAEELAFGEVSTGAQNDLQLATDLARRMVTQYGMSERLGLVSLEQEATPLLHPLPLQSGRRVSEATARVIDHEIAQLLQDARMRVRETLSNQRPLLDALARALLEKESLDRASLDALIALVGSTDSRSPPSPRIAARGGRAMGDTGMHACGSVHAFNKTWTSSTDPRVPASFVALSSLGFYSMTIGDTMPTQFDHVRIAK